MGTLCRTLILGWRSLDFAFPGGEAGPGPVFIQFGLANLHSQKAMRAPRCRLILGWRHLGFAFPKPDAIPMVDTHSGLAKLELCRPSARCETYDVLGWRRLGFAFPERDASHMVRIL